MNKKGMTLMELIISIAMLSVGLVFMYGLMVNLQKKKNENDAYTDDLIKVAEIETDIQKSIMSFADYGQKSTTRVRVWNDIWNTNYPNINEKSSYYIRIDITKNGKTQEKAIGYFPNKNIISIRVKDDEDKDGVNEWHDEKKWTLGDNFNNIVATEKCQFANSNLHCQINLNLYKDNKIIDIINVPLYIKTSQFYAGTRVAKADANYPINNVKTMTNFEVSNVNKLSYLEN